MDNVKNKLTQILQFFGVEDSHKVNSLGNDVCEDLFLDILLSKEIKNLLGVMRGEKEYKYLEIIEDHRGQHLLNHEIDEIERDSHANH